MKEPFDLNSVKNPDKRLTKEPCTPEELASLEERYAVSAYSNKVTIDQQGGESATKEEVGPPKEQTGYPKSWREGGPFLFGNMKAHEPRDWPLTAMGKHFFPHFMRKLDGLSEGIFDTIESFVKFVRGR